DQEPRQYHLAQNVTTEDIPQRRPSVRPPETRQALGLHLWHTHPGARSLRCIGTPRSEALNKVNESLTRLNVKGIRNGIWRLDQGPPDSRGRLSRARRVRGRRAER